MLLCHGHQDTALTAALCSLRTWRGTGELILYVGSHTPTKLSLAPLAKYLPSPLQLSPQTS
ncbi:hypothetical protein BpHYR1_032167 [Brachionus plicatilis]|uniref:Uncharacterized protein n=1 Tax=Brachionus plicatilis TaxID=10195 RepID=A0A3M7Q8N4_BRAPC|nr:hypothetical protein BpHYR1_032167 [Brachionus plicatilis]